MEYIKYTLLILSMLDGIVSWVEKAATEASTPVPGATKAEMAMAAFEELWGDVRGKNPTAPDFATVKLLASKLISVTVGLKNRFGLFQHNTDKPA